MTSSSTNANQTITGTNGNNNLRGGNGHDTITGLAGNDRIDGGAGNDWIDAGAGHDVVDGGSGNDTIYAGDGNDIVRGGDGDDYVEGGAGDDKIDGDDGNDRLYGGAGNDTIDGEDGNDWIEGGDGNDRLDGEDGDDVLLGGAGNDDLDGGCGDDWLDGGAGVNKLDGDSGNDVLAFRLADHAGEGVGSRYGYSELDGGSGCDTFVFQLTRAEWMRSDVQNDVARLVAYLRSGGSCRDFVFTSVNLKLDDIENFVVVVDGLVVDPRDEGVTLRADATTAGEDAPSLAFNLLANDLVPDQVRSVTVTNGAKGAVQLVTDFTDPAKPVANVVYTPNAAAYQYLAAGERATDSFTYTVTDADGDVSTQTVTVTIVGANDGPTIVSGAFAGAVVEDAASSLSASGAITFEDVDLTDSHSVSVGAAQVSVTGNPPAGFAGANGFGALTATVVENTADQNAQGRVNWTFTANNAEVQKLAAGQVATQVYTLTLTDRNGASVTQKVTITLTGTNDGPTVTAADAAGKVCEDGATAVAGNIGFADVDLIDTHGVTSTAQGSGYRGSFAAVIDNAATGDGTGNVRWSFKVDNAAIQDLAAGETLTQKYAVAVRDASGATVTQIVTVTIVGVNDAPVITSTAAAATGAVREAGEGEAGVASAAGQLASRDVDTGATATWSGSRDGAFGRFAIDPATGKWSYVLDNARAATQALRAGETRTEAFVTTVTDDKGATATQLVTVVVTGSNDAPTVTSSAAAATGAVREAGVAVGGNTPDAGTPQVTGKLAASDVDAGARLEWYGSAGSAYGNFVVEVDGSWRYFLDPHSNWLNGLAAGETVTDTFTATVYDEHGASASQIITITVTGTNDAPVVTSSAAAATGAVREDGVAAGGNTPDAGTPQVTGQLAARDVDHGAHLEWYGSAGSAYGSFVVEVDGSWRYFLDPHSNWLNDLAEGEVVTDTFTATVYDEHGASASQIITITVTGTNDRPVITSSAADAAGAVREAGIDAGTPSASGQLHAHDVDHGAKATWSIAGTSAYGAIAIDPATGRWTYTLDDARAATQALAAGDTKTESFTATVTDEHGATATQVVTVTITGTNDAPVAAADTGALAEDAVLTGSVATGDGDVDAGARLSYALDAPVAGLTLAADGGYRFETGDARYQRLALGEQLIVVAYYTVTDEHGASARATLTITLTGTNDAPTAAADTGTVVEDHVLTGSVATGDGDVDAGARLSWTLDAPVAGLTLAADGGYRFDAGDAAYQALALGEVRVVTAHYTVTDEHGATAQATLTITVTGTNDAPVVTSLASDAAGGVREDGTAAGVAVTGGQLASRDVDHGATATWSGSSDGTFGTFAINAATGRWTYTLANDRAATQALKAGEIRTETFVATVTDEHGATATQVVTVTITGSNDAPVVTSAAAAAAGAVTEAGVADAGIPSTTGQLTASDVDADATATWSIAGSSAYGAIAIDAATGRWTYTLADDRAATQALKAGEVRTETFTATVTDEHGATATQVVTVTITGSNDAPIVTSDAAAATGAVREAGVLTGGNAADAGTPSATGQLTSSDVDADATASWSIAGSSAYGAIAIDAATGAWAYTIDNARAATQALAAGEVKVETFTATVTDDQGATATQVVTITITGTNDAPTATADTASAFEDQATIRGSVATNDGDVDAGARLHYALDGAVDGLTLAADGSWRFDPSHAAYQRLAKDQELVIIASYIVTDEHGASATATLTITLTGTNDAPTARVDSAATSEDAAAFTGSVAGNDGDVDTGAVLEWKLVEPIDGLTMDAAGGYRFDPSHATYQALAQGETKTIIAEYQVTDEHGATAYSALVIVIAGTNDAPVVVSTAADAAGAVREDGVVAGTPSAAGQLASRDVDHGATATWSGSRDGAFGGFVIGANGAWTYTLGNDRAATQALKGGEVVTESFTATVTDDQGATATQVVTVTITGTNDAPVVTATAAAASGAVREAGVVAGSPAATGQLTSSDVDRDATATWSGDADGTYGRFAIAANGAWTYTLGNGRAATDALAAGETRTETFTATVTDDQGATATQVVTVTITGTNDAPVVTSNAADAAGAVVEQGVTVAGTPSAAGTLASRDVDTGATASWSGSANGVHGTFAIDAATGAWTYTLANDRAATQALAAGQVVTESFTATVTDDQGVTATQVVTVTITGTNDAPVVTSTAADAQAALTDVGEAGFLVARGLLTSSDVDAGATAAWSGSAAGTYGAFVIRSDGDWNYTLLADRPAVRALAAGEVVTDTFTATVTDEHGATATQVVTVTITGSNDTPVVTSTAAAAAGSVREAGNLDAGAIDAGTPSAGGQLTASDVDRGATLAWSGSADGRYGAFAIGADGRWSYALDNARAATQALAEGETRTDSFTATVKDEFGGTATQVVTVTVTGTNDSPVVTSTAADASGAVVEAGVVAGTPSASGTLTSSDVDHGATAEWSIAGPSAYGTIAIDAATGQWTYTLDNSRPATNALAAGETKTESFTATVTDDKGATATQVVTVTVTGTNDAPVAVADTFAGSAVATGTPVALSGQTIANTQLVNSQLDSAIAALGTGHVVVWTDTNPTDGAGTRIAGQRFDAAGQKLGAEFTVNTTTANNQTTAAVTQLTNGNFIVTWSDLSQTTPDTSVSAVRAQIFSADGVKVGSEFVANGITLGNQTAPTVSALAGGGFAIAYQDASNTAPDNSGSGAIRLSAFDAAGVRIVSDVLVNTTTAGLQSAPSIATLANGNLIVSWTDASATGGDTSSTAIRAQIVTAAGVKVGSEFLVNTQVVSSQFEPSVAALASGGFVVTWRDGYVVSDGSSSSVKAQVFDATGAKVGGEFLVNTATAGGQTLPTVTALAAGGFVIAWQDDTLEGSSNFGIRAQQYDAAGAKVGSEFGVNLSTAGIQFQPAVIELADGRLAFSYSDAAPGTYDIVVRMFSQTGAAGGYGENQTLTLDVLANDTDVDTGAVLTLVSATAPTGRGSATVANGKLVFDPGSDFDYLAQGQTTTVAVEYTIRDEHGATATTTATITITGTNDAPIVTSDAAAATGAVVEAGAVAGTPSATGTLTSRDVDTGATATWGGSAAGTYGSFAIDAATGRWTYTLDNARTATNALAAGQTVTETFTATVRDGLGGTATQVVTVTVTGTNDAPVAVAASKSVAEDATVSGTIGAADADAGAVLTYALTGPAPTGLTFNADGSYSFDANQPGFQALGTGQSAQVVVGYTVTDQHGAASTGTLTITVTGADDLPVLTLSNAPTTYVENAPAQVVDGALTLVDADGPNLNGAVVSITANFNAAQDSLSFTSQYGITGSYHATTGQLTLTGSATAAQYQEVLRSVAYRNNSDTPTTGDRTIVYAVTPNGTSSQYYAANGHFYEYVAASGISWTAAQAAAAARTLYGMTGYLATVTSAGENAFITTKLAGTGWIGATDAAVEGQWRWVTGPEAGQLFYSGRAGAGGAAVNGAFNAWAGGEPNQAGEEDYAHFYGNGQWNDLPLGGGVQGYIVEYGGMPGDAAAGFSGSAIVRVQAVDDAPVATGLNTAETYTEDQPLDLANIVAADADSATLTVTLTLSDPAAGALSTGTSGGVTATFDPATGVWTASGATANVNALLAGVSFVPAANFNGGFTIATSVSDGSATVTGSKSFTGVAVNDVPTVSGPVIGTATEDGAASTLDALANAGDLDGDALSVVVGTLPDGVSYDAATRRFTLDPTHAAFQSLAAGQQQVVTVSYQVSDGIAQVAASARWTVTGTNDAPTIAAGAVTGGSVTEAGNADTGQPQAGTPSVSGTLAAADADAGATRSWSVTGANGTAGTYGSFALDAATGKWTYTLDNARAATQALKEGQTATESFTTRVTDDQGAFVEQVVTVTVNGANDAPTLTAVNSPVTFLENAANATSQIVDSAVVFDDVDANLAGGKVVVSGLLAEDRVGVRAGGPLTISISTVLYNGVAIGVVSGGDGGNMTVTLTANATAAAVQALIQGIAYSNVSDTPTAQRTLVINVFDAAGGQLAASFGEQSGANNPFAGYQTQRSTPSFADIDGDGDLDLVVGSATGGLAAYRNNGNGSFTQLTGAANPFAGIGTPTLSAPAFADLNGDGRADLVLGTDNRELRTFFQNAQGQFVEATGAANPFAGVNGSYDAAPTFADIDGDGDKDLVLGSYHGNLRTFRNNGDNSFTELTGAANPLGGFSTGTHSKPAAVDFDGDGDLDIVSGSWTQGLLSYRNNGDGTFTQLTGAANPYAGVNSVTGSSVAFADLNRDGTADALMGGDVGTLRLFTSVNGARVVVNVTAQNDAPSGTNATLAVGRGTPLVLTAANFGFSDVEGNAFAGIVVTTLPGGGTLALNGVALAAGQVVTAADIAAGRLTFTAAANASGAGYAGFNFQVRDNGGTANSGIDTDQSPNRITFDAPTVNFAPAGANLTAAGFEDTAYALKVADFGFSDSDGNAFAFVRVASLPSAGTLRLNGVAVAAGQGVSVADIAAGKLTLTGNANATGTVTFTFQVQDDGGSVGGGSDVDPTPNTFTLTLANVNDAPTGADRTVTATEDVALTITTANFAFTDVETNGLAAVIITTLPTAGTLRLSGVAVTAGQAITAADIAAGRLTFLADANANGAGYASFTFQVQDNGGTANGGQDTDPSPNTITINVNAVNDPVTGLTLSASTAPENVPSVTIGTLAAVDADTADTWTYTIRPGLDGSLFTIVGNELRVGGSGLDYEAATTRQVIVRATDAAGSFFDRTITVQVLDSNEFTLTTGNEGIASGATNDQVIANSLTLNAGDTIATGGGTDELLLFGNGSFNLNQLGTYSGVETVRLINLTANTATLVLRNGVENDVLVSGTGATNITLNNMDSNVVGGDGDDVVTAGTGNVDIRTGNGNDNVTTGSGTAYVDTGSGFDTVTTGAGAATVFTGASNDTVHLGTGTATVDTGDQNDTVNHNGGAATIDTGSGDDTVNLGSGLATVRTGAGNDTIFYDNRGFNERQSIDGGAGTDTLVVYGIRDLTRATLTNLDTLNVQGLSILTAAQLAQFTSFVGTAAGRVTVSDAVVDLTGKTISTISIYSGNADGTLFKVSSALAALQIFGGSGTDTVQVVGAALTADQRDYLFATTSIETLIDSSGTYQAPPSGGSLFRLTTAVDTLAADAGDITVNATAGTLTSGDVLAGGGGTDTLAFYGSGTVNLGAYNVTGFEELKIVNNTASTMAITLRANETMNVTATGTGPTSIVLNNMASTVVTGAGYDSVQAGTGAVDISTGANRDDIYLQNASGTVDSGADNDYIYMGGGLATVTGGDGNDQVRIDQYGFNGASTVSGGNGFDYLFVAGNRDLTGNLLTGFEYLSTNQTVQLTAAQLGQFSQIYGSGWNGKVNVADAFLDLSGKTVGSVYFTSSNATGTTFKVNSAAQAMAVQGGAGNDTIDASGFTLSAAEKDFIFATGAVETVIDASGTYTAPAADPGRIRLTTGNDTLPALPDSQTVIATSATLTSGDSLAAGATGTDELRLYGGGQFNLSGLAGFSGFELVTVVNPTGQSADIYLRNGVPTTLVVNSNVTNYINAADAVSNITGGNGTDYVRLYNGNSTVSTGAATDELRMYGSAQATVDMGAGNDFAYVGTGVIDLDMGTGTDNVYDSYGLAAGSTLDGGADYDYLRITTSRDLTTVGVTGFESLNIESASATVKVSAAQIAQFSNVVGTVGAKLTTADAVFDLSGKFVSGLQLASTNAGGTLFKVSSAAAGLQVIGGGGQDGVEAVGFTFTVDQRTALLNGASVEYIVEGNTIYGGAGANTLTGTAAANTIYGNGGNDTIDGGAGADFLYGGDGNDVFVFRAGEANGDSVLDFTGNGTGAGDSLSFSGYGAGATFTQVNATQWRVASADGSLSELITFAAGTVIDPTDITFFP